jgi:thiosulfate dehydrogenase
LSEFKHNTEENYIEIIQRLVKCVVILLLMVVGLLVLNLIDLSSPKKPRPLPLAESKQPASIDAPVIADTSFVSAPDSSLIEKEPDAKEILYGKDLIAHTSKYFGPKGTILKISNGMNCQNCHLSAGTRPFGNNYLAVAPTYPKFRERSGSIETVYKRVNDCFERSLNGKALDTNGREMKAIAAYIGWLGKNMPKGKKPKGSGIKDLAYLDRAADPEKGKSVYTLRCKTCHGENGEGKLNTDGISYQYPPLWGDHSYNIGAGLYRISRLAGYAKYNMPNGATHDNPVLSDEEAWDVAAFVNSQPRPGRDLKADWPRISGKPVDHPFGPFADGFSETQHKYGPFGPIADARKKSKK